MDSLLPRPPFALVLATQVLLGTLFLAGIGGIAILPGLSAGIAESLPEYAGLRDPLLAVVIAIVVLALVALAMVALLVHRIRDRSMLNRTSLLWVDVIVATLACSIVLVVSGFALISNAQAGSPFIALILALAFLGFGALACIILVLRSLLRQAMLIRMELDEVV